MKYCKVTTVSHPTAVKYSTIIGDVLSILNNEGCCLGLGSPFYNKNFEVIDGDELEKKFCIDDGRDMANRNKSVDIIFAFDAPPGKKMQFVELKLRCKDKFYHLDKTSFRQKSDSSKNAISNHVAIAAKHLIVFEKSVLNQAKHFLYRINPILGNDFVAVDVDELYGKFFV